MYIVQCTSNASLCDPVPAGALVPPPDKCMAGAATAALAPACEYNQFQLPARCFTSTHPHMQACGDQVCVRVGMQSAGSPPDWCTPQQHLVGSCHTQGPCLPHTPGTGTAGPGRVQLCVSRSSSNLPAPGQLCPLQPWGGHVSVVEAGFQVGRGRGCGCLAVNGGSTQVWDNPPSTACVDVLTARQGVCP